jgi:autotransporter-associated beta strand protein
MKIFIVAAIRCSLLFLIPSVAYAISAQWDLDPISGDWHTAANWTPDGVPNGPADIATFGLSNTTNVSISEDTEVNGITFTPAATNAYVITVNPGTTLTLSGTGITNNSGTGHLFVLSSERFGEIAQMRFTNNASAGNALIDMDDGSSIDFLNRATAGSARIISFGNLGSSINFFDRSTAGSMLINNPEGFDNSVNFYDNSTAGTATLEIGEQGRVSFFDHSSAGSATIIGSGGEGALDVIRFFDSSSAGSATIQGDGAEIVFGGRSKGGTAAIGLFFSFAFEVPSRLVISGHDAPGVTIGSLEGDETATVFLGANNLTIGSNNLSTTFACTIQDGFVGTGGSLTKIGSGTLILSGANSYTGDTNVNRGVLQVDGSITSNTFVNHGGTLAGIGLSMATSPITVGSAREALAHLAC